jgi:hypothetical protein
MSRFHMKRWTSWLATPVGSASASSVASKLASLRPGGGRNIALFRAACSLGKFAHNGIVTDHEVRSALMDAARVNGYVAKDGEHQAQLTITSGFNISRNDPLPDLDSLPGASTRYSRRRG